MSVQWWKDIPGYEGKYQASRVGEIRHIYPSGHVRILKPYIKKEQRSRRRLFVHLVKDGIVKEYQVFRLVAAAFAKSAPPGMVLYHINGEVTDNRVDNIGTLPERSSVRSLPQKRISAKPCSRSMPKAR